MATETESMTDNFPWDAPSGLPATHATTLHILADTVTVEFGAETYPSLDIRSTSEGNTATFYLSLTGDAAQRQGVAAAFHEVADKIAAWGPVS